MYHAGVNWRSRVGIFLELLFAAVATSPETKAQGFLINPGDVVLGRFVPSDFQTINQLGPDTSSFGFKGSLGFPAGGEAKFNVSFFESATSTQPFATEDFDILDNPLHNARFFSYWAGTQLSDREGFYQLTYNAGDPVVFNGINISVYEGQFTYTALVVPEPSVWAMMAFGGIFVAGLWRRRSIR